MHNPINIKKISIILFFLSNLSYAQFTDDIGITLNTSVRGGIFTGHSHYGPQTGEKLIIDYRHALNDKLYFIGGLSFGISDGHYDRNFESNDLYQLNRVYGYDNKDFNLRAGIDRTIKESIFSIGGNLVFGLRTRDAYAYHSYSYYSEEYESWVSYGGRDPEEIEIQFNNELSSDLLRVTSKNIRLGSQVRLSAKVPFGKRLCLNGYVGGYGGVLLNTATDVHSDPLGETLVKGGGIYNASTLEFQVQYGVGLSYRLGSISK
ncbi:MAG: hypothetical protein GQ574_16525 [Crocinitomix sp.]|nr:hypothetical protein [Crocinitomix sp.]